MPWRSPATLIWPSAISLPSESEGESPPNHALKSRRASTKSWANSPTCGDGNKTRGQYAKSEYNSDNSNRPHLILVDTDNLGSLRGPEVQPGDIHEDLGECGGDDEDIATAGTDVGELDVELLVVVVEPASRDSSIHAVQGDDFILGEETIEEEADDASNGVLSEKIEGVVDADPVLNFSGVVADCAGDDTEDDGCPDGDVARRGCGSDETSDRTGTETDGGVLSLETEIELGGGVSLLN